MPCQTPSTKVCVILHPAVRTVEAHASEHAVNKLKGGERSWDDASEFDTEKDKTKFRQYDEACDRVRNFYKEQHGDFLFPPGPAALFLQMFLPQRNRPWNSISTYARNSRKLSGRVWVSGDQTLVLH